MLMENFYILCLRLKNVYLREKGIIKFMNSDKYTVHICNSSLSVCDLIRSVLCDVTERRVNESLRCFVWLKTLET